MSARVVLLSMPCVTPPTDLMNPESRYRPAANGKCIHETPAELLVIKGGDQALDFHRADAFGGLTRRPARRPQEMLELDALHIFREFSIAGLEALRQQKDCSGAFGSHLRRDHRAHAALPPRPQTRSGPAILAARLCPDSSSSDQINDRRSSWSRAIACRVSALEDQRSPGPSRGCARR